MAQELALDPMKEIDKIADTMNSMRRDVDALVKPEPLTAEPSDAEIQKAPLLLLAFGFLNILTPIVITGVLQDNSNIPVMATWGISSMLFLIPAIISFESKELTRKFLTKFASKKKKAMWAMNAAKNEENEEFYRQVLEASDRKREKLGMKITRILEQINKTLPGDKIFAYNFATKQLSIVDKPVASVDKNQVARQKMLELSAPA